MSDLVVAWVMFEDGTGAADLSEADDASVQAAVAAMVREKGAPVQVSGFMSLRTYTGLRRMALGRGLEGPSVAEMLLGGQE